MCFYSFLVLQVPVASQLISSTRSSSQNSPAAHFPDVPQGPPHFSPSALAHTSQQLQVSLITWPEGQEGVVGQGTQSWSAESLQQARQEKLEVSCRKERRENIVSSMMSCYRLNSF